MFPQVLFRDGIVLSRPILGQGARFSKNPVIYRARGITGMLSAFVVTSYMRAAPAWMDCVGRRRRLAFRPVPSCWIISRYGIDFDHDNLLKQVNDNQTLKER